MVLAGLCNGLWEGAGLCIGLSFFMRRWVFIADGLVGLGSLVVPFY